MLINLTICISVVLPVELDQQPLPASISKSSSESNQNVVPDVTAGVAWQSKSQMQPPRIVEKSENPTIESLADNIVIPNPPTDSAPPANNNALPPPNNIVAPPAGNNALPPPNNIVAPPADNNALPPPNNIVAPPAGNNALPPAGNNALPPLGKVIAPSAGNNALPPPNNIVAPPAGNNALPPPNNIVAPPADNNALPPPNNIVAPPAGTTSEVTSANTNSVATLTASDPSLIPSGVDSQNLDATGSAKTTQENIPIDNPATLSVSQSPPPLGTNEKTN